MRILIFILIIITAFSASAEKKHPQYRNTPELIEHCLIYKDQPVFPQLCDVLFDSLKTKGNYYVINSIIEVTIIDHSEKPLRFRLNEFDWWNYSYEDWPFFKIQIGKEDSLLIQNKFLFKFDQASIKEVQREYRKHYEIFNYRRKTTKNETRQKNHFQILLKFTDRKNISPKMWTIYFNTINLIYLMAKFEINDVAKDMYDKPYKELNNEEKLNSIKNSGYFIELLFN